MRDKKAPKPLPGSRQSNSKGMFPFVINLREQATTRESATNSASATKTSAARKTSTKSSTKSSAIKISPTKKSATSRSSANKSSSNKSSTTRRAVHDQYSAVTQTFIKHLQRELQEQELAEEVADYGEPNPFPVVTLTCSERVASVIEKMPEVLDIYRDDEPSLGIVKS